METERKMASTTFNQRWIKFLIRKSHIGPSLLHFSHSFQYKITPTYLPTQNPYKPSTHESLKHFPFTPSFPTPLPLHYQTMNLNHLSLSLLLLVFLLPPSHSQVCQRFCGDIQLRYPFGGGPGCGDPRFVKHVTCNQRQLTFITHTGSYPVTNIDYDNEILYVSDPTMSTCFCTQPSKGFSLDWDAPFSFHDSSVFALLDCSLDSSPMYKGAINGNITNVPQCDNTGTLLRRTIFSYINTTKNNNTK